MPTNQCTASIAVKGNKIKSYNGSFYLKSGQEFEIDLQNFTKDIVAAQLFMNGKAISNSMLVLKPGQKVLLTRYLDEAKKFLFETYKVDGSPETQKAIEDNGNIEVKFYKEKPTLPVSPITYTTASSGTWWGGPIYGGTTTGTVNVNNMYNSLTGTTSSSYGGQHVNSVSKSLKSRARGASGESATMDWMAQSEEVETGRVEKGSYSDQKFKNFVGDFETYPFQIVKIKLLPHQYKPLTVSDLAEYCVECGTKNKKGNYKFCPKCGTKY
jgi:hypothetical protein